MGTPFLRWSFWMLQPYGCWFHPCPDLGSAKWEKPQIVLVEHKCCSGKHFLPYILPEIEVSGPSSFTHQAWAPVDLTLGPRSFLRISFRPAIPGVPLPDPGHLTDHPVLRMERETLLAQDGAAAPEKVGGVSRLPFL